MIEVEEEYRKRAREIHKKLIEAHEKGVLELEDRDAALAFSYLAVKLLEEPSSKRRKVYPDLDATHLHVLLAAAARALGVPLEDVRARDILMLLDRAGVYAFVSDIMSTNGVRKAVQRIVSREEILNEAIRRLLQELKGQHSRSSSS